MGDSAAFTSPVSEQVTSEVEHSIGRLCCLILMPLDRCLLQHERLKMCVGRFFNTWRTFDKQDVSGIRCIDDSVIEPRKCFNTQKQNKQNRTLRKTTSHLEMRVELSVGISKADKIYFWPRSSIPIMFVRVNLSFENHSCLSSATLTKHLQENGSAGNFNN